MPVQRIPAEPLIPSDPEDPMSEFLVRPDIEHLVIEDGVPVDNFQSEKQQRLLVETLYSNAVIPLPFIAAANVGIFYAIHQKAIVPDVFLSLDVAMPADWSQKQNRTYMVWEFGKVPEVAIEADRLAERLRAMGINPEDV